MPESAGAKSVSANRLLSFFDETLSAREFSDYCPNGLQVQGQKSIRRLITGVTASANLIASAERANADAILVHHGYFWRGEDPCLVGMKRERIARLLKAGINLYAYHLPLDAHPELGNNAQLAAKMGWKVSGRCGPNDLVFYADLARPTSVSALLKQIKRQLSRQPMAVGPDKKSVRRIAWCTGAAQDYMQAALLAGADVFISGEISERTTHDARENKIAYICAGHHATERYGVQALGAAAAAEFGITHRFIDDDNPV